MSSLCKQSREQKQAPATAIGHVMEAVLYPAVVRRREMMTPERARMELEKATGRNYRAINERFASMLTREFLSGRFEFSHKPIEFDEMGVLHDGQHRLWACWKSGLTLPFECVYGSTPLASEGTVRPREASDHLKHAGHVSVSLLAAIAKLVAMHEHGKLAAFDSYRMSPAEITATIARHPDLPDFVRLAHCQRNVSATHLGAVLYIACRMVNQRDAEIAGRFMEELRDGVGLRAASPTHILRERMISNSKSKTKIVVLERLALLIKCWNAWIEGCDVKLLQWRTGGQRPEPFPEIK